MGINCSTVVPDSPQKTNNANVRHWRFCFQIYTILGFQKKSKLVSSARL